MTVKDKILLEKKIYGMVKESLFNSLPIFREKSEKGSSDNGKNYDDDEEGETYEKYGLRIVKSDEGIDDAIWGRLKNIIPMLQDSNDDSVNSFNLTRSQIAYELWPELDKDSARSKLSQKIEGKKSWQEWELNKLANIVSGNSA